MEEISAGMNEESLVLHSMVNLIQLKRLKAARSQFNLRCKKNECAKLNTEITKMKGKMKSLLKKKRRLDTPREPKKKLRADTAVGFLVSSLKAEILELKKSIDDSHSRRVLFLTDHQNAWKKAEADWNNDKRMARVQELKKRLVALQLEIEQIAKENEAKKIHTANEKHRLQKAVIKFAEMMVTKGNYEKLATKNSMLREKLENANKSAVSAVKEQINFHAQAMADFEIFDGDFNDSLGNLSIEGSCNGDSEFDFNCSVLSLEASQEVCVLSIGTPQATSTPTEAAQKPEELDEDPLPVETVVQIEEATEEPSKMQDEEKVEEDAAVEPETVLNRSDDIDYHAMYRMSPENSDGAVTSPPPAAATPTHPISNQPAGFNFFSNVQLTAESPMSLFGFGATEPSKTSSIFNLF